MCFRGIPSGDRRSQPPNRGVFAFDSSYLTVICLRYNFHENRCFLCGHPPTRHQAPRAPPRLVFCRRHGMTWHDMTWQVRRGSFRGAPEVHPGQRVEARGEGAGGCSPCVRGRRWRPATAVVILSDGRRRWWLVTAAIF